MSHRAISPAINSKYTLPGRSPFFPFLFLTKSLPCQRIQNERPLYMDVIFNCPKCEQELAVDASGAGTEINCPSCGEAIIIPEPERGAPPRPDSNSALPRVEAHPVNPIASSAAAKVEMHLRVPVHKTPAASLIEKPLPPLEVSKDGDKKIRTKTIRHTDCVEVGHDRFDEIVSTFLAKVGETNIINISPLTYTHVDIGSQKILTDFGVLIVYKG